MMSQVIRQETLVFLKAILHGAALSLLYDGIRSVRRVVAHSPAAVSAEDFLFWLAAGFLTFCLLFLETDGVIRGYVAVGAGLGVILYRNLFSRLVVGILSGVLKLILSAFRLAGGVVGKACRTACRPFRFALRCLCLFLRKIGKKIKKRIEIANKRVYNKKGGSWIKKGRSDGNRRNTIRGRGNGSKKKAYKRKQPKGNAGNRRGSTGASGGAADPKPETDG